MISKSKKGSVLLYVIMIFCLMTILGMGMVFLANHNTKMTQIEMHGEQAYQSALSGLETTLDAFVKEPTTGQNIALKIRNEKSSISTTVTNQEMGKIDITITCAEDDRANCKKLRVDSTATYKGLTKSVIGYLNIIEGGLEKPIVVEKEVKIDKGNGANTQICSFPLTPNSDDRTCVKGNDDLEGSYQKIDKIIDLEKYKKFIESKVSTISYDCFMSFENEDSCKYTVKDSDGAVNLKIDNENKTEPIYIDLTMKDKEYIMVNIELTDKKANNVVVVFLDPINVKDWNIGTNSEDSDNILIMFKPTSNKEINFYAQGKNLNFNGWILAPFNDITLNGGQGLDVTINGGVIANSLQLGKFSTVNGVKPSDGMMALLGEGGFQLGEETGGAMTFGKTYDE